YMTSFQLFADMINLLFGVKPKVEGGWIIPASRGVQFRAGRSDFLRERAFDIHVDVLERFVPLEFSGTDFLFDLAQPGLQFFLLRGGKDPRFGERARVSDRTGDIVPVKSLIERN